jgi:hypothetical protein
MDFEAILDRFRQLVENRLSEGKPSHGEGKLLRVVSNPALTLLTAVNEVEATNEFKDLVRACEGKFSGEHHSRTGPTVGEGEWRDAVKNLLRRSGFYKAASTGTPTVNEQLNSTFVEAFSARPKTTTYLIPLELVSFKLNRIEGGGFEICRFSKRDLNAMLQTQEAEAFYPTAVWDTDKLRHYHFVVISDKGKRTRIGFPFEDLNIDLSDAFQITWSFTSFPKKVEEALSLVALVPWREDCWRCSTPMIDDEKHEGAFAFGVPFVASIHDDLLTNLPYARDCEDLEWDPNPEYDRPYFLCCLDAEDSERTGEFLRNLESLIQRSGGWSSLPRWMSNALGFFLKASQASEREAILWYTVTIEALLGKTESGLTSRIAERVDALGIEDEKRFKEIYDHRCALVHGRDDIDSRRIWRGDARDARKIARQALLWFLNFSAEINKIRGEVSPMKRADILDLISHRPQTWRAFAALIQELPEGFPAVATWLGTDFALKCS